MSETAPTTQYTAHNLERRTSVGRGSAVPVAVVAASLLLTGCGSNEPAERSSAAAESGQSAAESFNPDDAVEVTFDDLGASYPTIFVYPGVSESAADRMQNSEYRDGETVYGLCKTIGRLVNSDTDAGEPPVSSDQWIRIHNAEEESQYATAVYIQDAEEALAALPEC